MVYFLADAHLGAADIDDPREHERSLVALLDRMGHDATEIYLMGDMLDFWFEYHDVVPRGFVRFFGALARLSDSGVKLHWVRGNHDMWIHDYLPSEIGLEMIDGPQVRTIMGKRFLLDHGDAVGPRPLSFRIIRAIFRNALCRRLYAMLHPRIAMAVAHGWSGSSRRSSIKHRRRRGLPPSPEANAATEPLAIFGREYVAAHPHDPVDFMVFGHRHVLMQEPVGPATRLVLLGDWLHHGSYASFDGTTLTLHSSKQNH